MHELVKVVKEAWQRATRTRRDSKSVMPSSFEQTLCVTKSAEVLDSSQLNALDGVRETYW